MSNKVSVNQVPKYVQCVRTYSGVRMEKGKVYEVTQSEDGEYFIVDGRRHIGWLPATYFIAMPPTYDHKEETVRKILTSINRDCTCTRCGAPTPCAYHV
jgi:hypothetical protein